MIRQRPVDIWGGGRYFLEKNIFEAKFGEKNNLAPSWQEKNIFGPDFARKKKVFTLYIVKKNFRCGHLGKK